MSILSLFEVIFWMLRLFVGARVGPEEGENDGKHVIVSPLEKKKQEAFKTEESNKLDYGQFYAPSKE